MTLQIIPDSEKFEKRFENKLQELAETIIKDLRAELNSNQREEFLTRHEIAEMLKVHVCTIDDWTDRGKLKKYNKYGRRALYKYSEVEASLIHVDP